MDIQADMKKHQHHDEPGERLTPPGADLVSRMQQCLDFHDSLYLKKTNQPPGYPVWLV